MFWINYKKTWNNDWWSFSKIYILTKLKQLLLKWGYYLEILIPETINLLGSTENKITKEKNGENEPHLEITEVMLVQCNIVNNGYQQDSTVLYTLVPNKSCGQLLKIANKLIDRINLTLVIK